MRRGGFPTRKAAEAALDRVRDRLDAGVAVDDRQTVAEYLEAWLASKVRLRAATAWSYRYAVDLWTPRIGHIRLEHLSTSTSRPPSPRCSPRPSSEADRSRRRPWRAS
jgi:hypothetical protein